MTIETFDQRFKRLTSDMLMIDICRLLGIEIRQLMKIRAGVRIELSMSGLRKLCLEQGLDFASFTRGYADPWSSELSPTETVTSDEPTEAPMQLAKSKGSGPIFRSDGSRIPQATPPKRSSSVETVRSTPSDTPPALPKTAKPPALPDKKIQVSFRPSKSMTPPTVPEKYDSNLDDDFIDDDDDDSNPQNSIAARLRGAMALAFRRNTDAQTEQAELYSGVAPARLVTTSGSSESPSALRPAQEHQPTLSEAESTARPASSQAKEIQSLVSEVSSLRREINYLSTSVRELLER